MRPRCAAADTRRVRDALRLGRNPQRAVATMPGPQRKPRRRRDDDGDEDDDDGGYLSRLNRRLRGRTDDGKLTDGTGRTPDGREITFATELGRSTWWCHYGFLIDDVAPSASVLPSGERVDLYAYTSMAVATIQEQQAQIDALRAEVDALKAQVAKP